jgi:hypothetical protein
MTRKKRQRFVPRVVLGMGIVGVVPACAIQACSSGSLTQAQDAGNGRETGFGVADSAFAQGVAASCFTSPNACPDAHLNRPDSAFSVANSAFGDADATTDSPEDIQDGGGGPDQILAVAFLGFSDVRKDRRQV